MDDAMRRVFQIPMVVQEIIDQLKLKDLKTTRLVCSMWSETATKIILKKDCSQVSLTYNWNINKFQKNSRDSQKVSEPHVTHLTEIIEKSSQFPCSTFTISNGNIYLDDPETDNFFKVAGGRIKTLIFDTIFKISSATLRKILVVDCPNVEGFRFHVIDFIRTEDFQFELPNLKVLSVEDEVGEGLEIFRTISAPNLQVIKDFDFSYDTMDVVNAGKVHTVKELKLGTSMEYTPPDLLQAFVSAGPLVQVLTFCFSDFEEISEDWRVDFTRPFQKLLDTCKDTLKIFKFIGLGFLFENLRFPRFSQLTKMSLHHDPDLGTVRMFPIRINLTHTFPSLKVLDVSDVELHVDDNWDKYFPPPDAYRGQLTFVTSLRVCQKCKELELVRKRLRLICSKAIISYRDSSLLRNTQ